MNDNIIIIILTTAVSIICFNNRTLFYRLSLNPYSIRHQHQWWRIITHGFVHADYVHLLINMLVLWSFGRNILFTFESLSAAGVLANPGLTYWSLYLGALVFSSFSDVVTRKDDYRYNSIGASGAVSAVVFLSIFFNPWGKIYVMGLLPVPSIIFGALYLWYSQYMNRRGGDNTNHMAHFWGSVFGLLFPLFIDPRLYIHFINELFHPRF